MAETHEASEKEIPSRNKFSAAQVITGGDVNKVRLMPFLFFRFLSLPSLFLNKFLSQSWKCVHLELNTVQFFFFL